MLSQVYFGAFFRIRVDTPRMPAPEQPPPVPQPAKSRRKVLWLLIPVGALFLVEAGARLLPIGPSIYSPRRLEPEGKVPFVESAEGLYLYRPNASFASVYDLAGDKRGYLKPDGRIAYEINSLGLRGGAIVSAKRAGLFRVICLGDSLTFGEGVRVADTYPARLQVLMSSDSRRGDVEVANAGVQGFGTVEEVKFFEAHCASLSPDVVILQFFLNDAMPFAETIRLNDAQSSELGRSGMARVSKVWEIFERRGHSKRLQEQYFRAIRDSFESPRWRECKEALNGLNERAKLARFRLVVVIFPVLWGLDGVYPFGEEHALVRRACEQVGAECVDLFDSFRGRRSEDLWVHPTDQHPNEIAHKLAAEAVAARLSQRK
jgi:hypothetical protein